MARTTTVLAVIAAWVAFSIMGCAQIALHEQVTSFDVAHAADSGISVTTRNGFVTIRRSQVDEVTVTARLAMTSTERLEQTTINAQRTAEGTLEITVTPADGRWRPRESCSFEVLVPEANGVDVRTSNGRIEIEGLAGPATLRTSNGRIVVAGHEGNISATTSNGALQIKDFAGDLRARTSNGAVALQPAAGSSGVLDVRTSNGSVTLGIPAGPFASEMAPFTGRLELRTSNGSIRIDEGVNAQMHKSNRNSASISLGEGGATSQLQTSNGRIRVESVKTAVEAGS